MPRIAVLPGDGIGPEETAAAQRVLASVRPDLECTEYVVGAAAIRAHGTPFPQETARGCADADAILFGAVGGYEFDGKPVEERPEAALFALRKTHDLYANIRPVRVFNGLEAASSLRPELVRGLDLIVLRELTSGLYFGEKRIDGDGNDRVAFDTLVYRVSEIERIVRFGFELARGRRKKLTSVDKLNVLATSRLWREIVLEVASEYPDVTVEHLLVDNAAMQLVRRPRDFDVIVTENMFGDILSDEAAMLTGSIGNLPSASLGTRRTGFGTFGLYEPISGTAPDIAGRGIANPTAAILSAALLCRYSLSDDTAATRIENAVADAFARGARTADLASDAGGLDTSAFTGVVLDALVAHA